MADAGDPVGDPPHLADVNASKARTVRVGVASLCLVQFVDVLGVTVMVTALPAMLADLRAPSDAASLISTGYAMFFGGLLMFGARLGDRFGHRRIIVTGLAIFTVAAVEGATATLTTSSAITLATLYLQNTQGHSPLVAGLMLLPFSLAVIVGSALAAPALARRPPQRLICAGLGIIAVSDAALVPAASSAWALPICVAASGPGIGLSSVAATRLGTSVPVAARGTASGVINTAAQLGTALGIATLLLVAALSTGIPWSGSSGITVAARCSGSRRPCRGW
jgi:MFS family permease